MRPDSGDSKAIKLFIDTPPLFVTLHGSVFAEKPQKLLETLIFYGRYIYG